MSVKLIIAVDQGNAIGWADGRLPWKIPYDMKRFKELTTDQAVLMGFNTFKSLNRPAGLPNRKNIVLTRKPWAEARTFFAPDSDIDVISNLEYVAQAEQRGGVVKGKDLWIIGGASVYAEALERQLVDELHVTLVHDNSGADVTLPFELFAWKLFILHQRKLGVNWEYDEFRHERPTVAAPSPGIDILVFRKLP
jgi:dihydrofolate reductase